MGGGKDGKNRQTSCESPIALEDDLMPDFVTPVVLFSTLASAVTLTVVLAFV